MNTKGYYVMGRYTSLSWHATREQAEKEVQRIIMVGAWHGMPPRVEESK